MLNINTLSFHSILTYAVHKLKDKYKIKFSKSNPTTTEVVSKIFTVSNFSYKGYKQQEIVLHFLGNDIHKYYNKITLKNLKRKEHKLTNEQKQHMIYITNPNSNIIVDTKDTSCPW